MNIGRFCKETASPAHEGSILASQFLPEGVTGPFGHAWGYLEPGKAMAVDSHPHYEVYVIIKGTAAMSVNSETEQVESGDVIDIPPNATHRLTCGPDAPLLWAALWWNAV